jgi:hypothetical protein
MLGSNDKLPLSAIAPWQAALSRMESKNIPAHFVGGI